MPILSRANDAEAHGNLFPCSALSPVHLRYAENANGKVKRCKRGTPAF
jgi:hypothetical protein